MSDRHFQRAHKTHMSGDRQAARLLYEEILKKTPKHIDARYMLGTLLAESGEYELALSHLKNAANRMPTSPMIHTNIGSVYLKLGRLDEASEYYKKSLRLDPHVPETLFNLGVIFYQQKKLEEAVTYIEKSVELRPDFSLAYATLGKIHQERNHPDLAVASYTRQLEYHPSSVEALVALGNIAAARQNYSSAMVYFKRVLEIDPANDSAHHAVAALSGETTSTAPKQHVEQLFDGLADSFDSHLTGLKYRVPEMLREMLAAATENQQRFERAIDLGCGTGLAGIQLKPMVEHLTGLDLSKKMVEASRAKGIYDELVVSDIYEYLASSQQRYDLFVATDVFIYVGDLSGIFEVIGACARERAYFLFSIEEVLEQDFILRPSGRYAHSRNYIEKLAVKNGFLIEGVQATDLRMEDQRPIKGDLLMLRHVKNNRASS